MVKYCKGLKFEEDPNYEYIKGLLKTAFENNGFEYDFGFDWLSLASKKSPSLSTPERVQGLGKKQGTGKVMLMGRDEEL